MTNVIEQTDRQAKVHSRAVENNPSHSSKELWTTINWKRAEKHVRRIQERIYRATKNQQWKKVKNLQKLLAKSYFNKIIAIKEVTVRNKGRKTPGIDNNVYDTDEKRWELSKMEFNYRTHKPRPVKRVFIPKPDGTKRPLGIPTMDDRILQHIIKSALEPEWEARFEPHSYGFRPGRCTMDAISEIRNKIGWSKTNVWILDADISKCFDNIAHEPLLQQIPVFRNIIKRWLRAGTVILGEYSQNTTGTPQGGVISPLLANIALNGMEQLLVQQKTRVSLVRYADDFVVIASSKIILERYVLPKLKEFLFTRGLSINSAKTNIVHRTEGFSFLGFTIKYFEKRHGSILLITPLKRNISAVLKKIKIIFRQSLHRPLADIIPKLNRIIRGWVNYFQFVNSNKSFSFLSHRIFKIVWKGLRRLHPQKPAKWLIKQYFQSKGNQFWKLVSDGISLYNPKDVRIKRYYKVKDHSSPFDVSQAKYWEYRASRN